MNSAEKQAVLHCLKSMIDEEVCEECPLYGTTGTDHCEKDCVRLAINALEQEPKLRQALEMEKGAYNALVKNIQCSDCISRQAAINVAIDAVDDWDGGCNLSREEYIRKALETLPPVTPTEKVGHWEWNHLPTVKPQYTDAEIQKMQDLESVEIQKAYEIGKDEGSEVLDKIRAELHATAEMHEDGDYYLREEWIDEIFDKYKASPTGEEVE